MNSSNLFRYLSITIFLVLILGSVWALAASDLYVDDDYDATACTNDGYTWQTDCFDSIQDAVNAASPADIIHVAAGTYNESVVIDKTLTLRGYQADIDPRPSQGGRTGPEAIIDAGESSGYVIRISSASDVEINGFSITGGTGDMVEESGHADNLLFQYNILYDDLATAGDEGLQVKYSDGVLIQYNYAYDIIQDGLNLSASTNGTVQYNEVHDNYSDNAAIYCYGATNIDIIGNLVYDVYDNDGIKLGDSEDGSTGGTVSDNVVHDSAEDGITIYASGVTVENNEVYNCGSQNGALYLYGADNSTVNNNEIHDNDAIGILIRNTDNVSGTENEVYNNESGLRATGSATNIDFSTDNQFYGNAGFEVKNENAGELDATYNWWGSASGPGSKISGNVAYCPWLDAAPPTGTATGPAVNQGTGTGYCSIQAAIDAATAGDTINVAPGTYDEMISINKALTLNGANAGIHPAVGTSTTETVGTRGDESVLSHDGLFAIRPSANNITIDGFKFTGDGGRIIDTYDDADNFTLKNCIFDNDGVATTQGVIQFGGGSHTGMTIQFNLFQDKGDHTLYTGGGPFDNLYIANNKFNVEGDSLFWTASVLVDGIIEENEFDGTIGGVPGTGFNTINAGQIGNVIVRDNWFHDCQYTPIQMGIVNGSITGNTFERMYPYPGVGADAIQLWGGEWGTPVATNVTISGNTIRFNDIPGAADPSHGVRLRADADAPNIHINNNSFEDDGERTDAYAVRNQSSAGTADATNNWWGSAAGPDAALFDGSVDYCPWLDAAPPAGSSYYPVENTTTSTGYCSIQAAIDAATAGDTITVGAGTYNESVSVNKSNLTLTSAAKHAAIVQGNFDVANGADNATIEKFKITPTSGDAIHVRTAGNATISENHIIGQGPTGGVDGIVYTHSAPGTAGTITDNEIQDAELAIYLDHDGLLDFTITGNTITDSRKGIGLGSGSGGTIQNNTVTGCTQIGMEIFNVATILENTITGNATGIHIGSGADHANIHINENNISGNTAPTTGVNNAGTTDVDATLNWWGDASGPTHASNPPGTGDTVSDYVLFSPWWSSEDGSTTTTYDNDGDDTVDTSGIPGMDSMEFDDPTTDYVEITYRGTNPAPSDPSTIGFLGNFYDIESGMADGTFTVTIVFSYTEAELAAAGISEDDDIITVTYWDGSAWVPIPQSNINWNKAANTVTVTLDHFTPFSVIAATTVEVYDITPETAKSGEDNVGILEVRIENGAAFDDELDKLVARINATNNSDIERAVLYKDDGDGVFGPASDTELKADNSVGNGKAVFKKLNDTIASGTTQHYFVAFDLMPWAYHNNTVDAWIRSGDVQMEFAGSNSVDLDPAGFTTVKNDPEATINLYHDGAAQELRVWGLGTTGTSSATIKVFDTSNNLLYSYTSVSLDANMEYDNLLYSYTSVSLDANMEYEYFIDISLWELIKYNIVVEFYDSEDVLLISVGDLFDDLYMLWLEERITTAEGDVDQLEIDLTALQGDVETNEDDITALEGRMNTVENDIADLQAEVGTLQGDVSGLQNDLTALEGRVSGLEADVLQLRADLDAWNHGTIWLVWDSDDSRLRVKGTAPIGTSYATIKVYDEDDNELPALEQTVTPDPSDLYYKYDYDVSSWGAQVYNIKAAFYDAGDNKIDRWVTTLFTALALEDLQDQIDGLEGRVGSLETDLAALEARVAANEGTIAQHETEITDLQGRMAAAEADILDLYSEVSDLHAMDASLQSQIDALDSRLSYLEDTRIPALESRVTALEEMIARMNHGTINLYHSNAQGTLRVWGEAPEGTSWATIEVYDMQDSLLHTYTPISVNADNEYGHTIDLTADEYEALKYNVMVKFYNAGEEFISEVGDLFDDLYIIWLGGRITEIEEVEIPRIDGEINDLWDANAQQAQQIAELQSQLNDLNAELTEMINDLNAELQAKIMDLQQQINDLSDKLEAMNHGTISVAYDAGSDYARVWGEAPLGTTAIDYYVVDDFGNYAVAITSLDIGETLNPTTHQYEFDLDTPGWNAGNYTVFVLFGGDESLDVAESFEIPYFGFSEISTSNRVETYFTHYAEVPIDYCIEVEQTGLYNVAITDREEFTQILRSHSLESGTLYCFNDDIIFEELGYWEFYLELWHYEGEEWVYEFGPISMSVVDLADDTFIQDSTITVTAPTPNVESTYWTNQELVLVNAVLGENTPTQDNYCDVFYESNEIEGYTEYLSRLPVQSGEGKYCQGQIRTSRLDSGAQGVYRLGIEAEFEAGLDAVDYFYIGFDVTPPEIVEIVDPGIISGTVTLQTDVQDSDSGVDRVWISIQDKDTGQLLWTGEAFYNSATGYYEVDFDSGQEDPEILDGPYNLYVEATDNAGNSSTDFIDPVIDNTKPVIESWSMDPQNPVRGETIEFEATVSDNMTGVKEIRVEISEQICGGKTYSVKLDRVTGDEMSGTYRGRIDSNNEFADCNYLATITATDNAENSSDQNKEFALSGGTEKEGEEGESVIVWPESASVKSSQYNDTNDYYNFWLDGNTEQWVKVLLNDEWVSVDANIDGNSDLKVLPGQNIIAIIQEASITSLYWDSSRNELNITADGTGEQEIVVYVNGNGEPNSVKFDGSVIENWSYDSTKQTVTFTVDLGSPHGILLSWYTPPKETEETQTVNLGGGGGGGGGAPAYYCGDGTCSSSENYCDCPEDCEAIECGECEEISCETGEPVCVDIVPCAGNEECEEGENCETVPEDCDCGEFEECIDGECVEQPYCGDNVCQSNENCTVCPDDCGCPEGTACVSNECQELAFCGDGTCGPNESNATCPEDCEAIEEETEPEPTVEVEETPAAPAGFFGLGSFADAMAGFLVVVIIIGGAVYFKFRGK